jgi:hypothetical protein
MSYYLDLLRVEVRRAADSGRCVSFVRDIMFGDNTAMTVETPGRITVLAGPGFYQKAAITADDIVPVEPVTELLGVVVIDLVGAEPEIGDRIKAGLIAKASQPPRIVMAPGPGMLL